MRNLRPLTQPLLPPVQSKVVEEHSRVNGMEMELTSQGAGTYWYDCRGGVLLARWRTICFRNAFRPSMCFGLVESVA